MLRSKLLVCMFVCSTACFNLESKQETKSPAKTADALAQTQALDGLAANATVQRKRAFLLRDTIAKALVLHPQGQCMELGKFPCAETVHLVSLGGMSAYANSQYHYPEDISITSPISLDRLVLSACLQRAQIDLSNKKSAVIFKDIELTLDGRLVDTIAVDKALSSLYERALLREASAGEIATLKNLYEQIYAEEPVGASINWMVLACYSVLSSVESAFY